MKRQVLKEIEELRYVEEQKTIKLKAKEKKEAEETIIALHKDKIKFEQEKKLESDLQTIKAQELSNLRQHAEKAKHEKEIKAMEVEQEKFRAQKELEKAVEQASTFFILIVHAFVARKLSLATATQKNHCQYCHEKNVNE